MCRFRDADDEFPDEFLSELLAVVVSVCRTPVLYRNGCTDQADFLHTSFLRVLAKLGYLDFRGTPNVG